MFHQFTHAAAPGGERSTLPYGISPQVLREYAALLQRGNRPAPSVQETQAGPLPPVQHQHAPWQFLTATAVQHEAPAAADAPAPRAAVPNPAPSKEAAPAEQAAPAEEAAPAAAPGPGADNDVAEAETPAAEDDVIIVEPPSLTEPELAQIKIWEKNRQVDSSSAHNFPCPAACRVCPVHCRVCPIHCHVRPCMYSHDHDHECNRI